MTGTAAQAARAAARRVLRGVGGACSHPALQLAARSWPLVVLALCVAGVVHDSWQLPFDSPRFSATGRKLWSPDWLNTFSDRWVQAGVAQLSLYGLTSRVERTLGLPAHQLVSAIIQLSVSFGFVGLVALPHRMAGRRVPRVLLLGAALTLWLLAIPSELYLAGHPAQFGITALWVLAAAAAQRGRPGLAGLLVALSTSFEPWGALGVPLLLLLPDHRRLFAAAAWCALGLVVLWGPFVAFGEFAMHEYRWRIRPESVLAPLLGSAAPFPWPLRLLQGGAALTCGALTARLLRRSQHALWAVPMAVVAARLLLDPVVTDYYWSPVKVLGLVAVASFLALRDERGVGVVPLLYPVLLLGLLPHWVVSLSVLAGVGVLARAASPASRDPGDAVTDLAGPAGERDAVPA